MSFCSEFYYVYIINGSSFQSITSKKISKLDFTNSKTYIENRIISMI
jgi:hypothetical protein